MSSRSGISATIERRLSPKAVVSPTTVIVHSSDGSSSAPWVVLCLAIITLLQTVALEYIRRGQTAKNKVEMAKTVADDVVSRAEVTTPRDTPRETPAAKSEAL